MFKENDIVELTTNHPLLGYIGKIVDTNEEYIKKGLLHSWVGVDFGKGMVRITPGYLTKVSPKNAFLYELSNKYM